MAKKTKKLTLSEKIKQLAEIPFSIKWVSISLFLFTMGWGLGADTFFSIYVKSIIGSGLNLTLIWTLLPIIKLLTVIPIGILNGRGMSKYLLLYGKIWYALSGHSTFGQDLSSQLFLLFVQLFSMVLEVQQCIRPIVLYIEKKLKQIIVVRYLESTFQALIWHMWLERWLVHFWSSI